MKYKIKRIKTAYWKPGTNYLRIVLKAIDEIVENGDAIIISEKAISTAKGNLVDESKIRPSLLSRFIAKCWMRNVWGLFLGNVSHFKPESIYHFRHYPLEKGACHKQLALRYSGLLQSLKHASEGGIDISNLPFAYACLPLDTPEIEAQNIYMEIKKRTEKETIVIIADTDSTFSFYNFHMSVRKTAVKGIKSFGGTLSFIFGRALRLKQRATPLAVVGLPVSVEEALELSEIAHHKRGYGAGRTVYDSASFFSVEPNETTWEMLERVDHYPIVIIRRV